MTLEIGIVLTVAGVAMAMWAAELWPIDQVALAIPVVLVVAGVLDPEEAFAGFAGTAVVTIAAIFVVSGGLVRSGAVAAVGDRIIHWSGGEYRRLLLLVMLVMLVSSAFINNTAIVAMFLPVILTVTHEFDIAASRLLMPLSFASILGGTCSLIGTSTNLLVHGLLLDRGMEGLGMFEITPLGLISGAIGIVYLYFLGPHLLPARGKGAGYQRRQRGADEYVTEVQVAEDSELVGRPVLESLVEVHPEVEILQVVRGQRVHDRPLRGVVLQEGDVLRIQGDVNTLMQFHREPGLEMQPRLQEQAERDAISQMALAELVVVPNSLLEGRSLDMLRFRERFGVSVIALQRHGEDLRDELSELVLKNGDVLLVMGEEEDVARLSGHEEFIVLQGVQELMVKPGKAPIAVAIVAGLVTGIALGLQAVTVLAVAAALLMVISGCLSLKEAYRAVDVSVLILIGGAISLGEAMTSSGAAELLARGMVDGIGPHGPYALLAATYLLTTVLTETMTNNAAAVLVVPLAVGVAEGMQLDPRPFVVAVAFAASASFTTPIGYQTNTLIYGPGGYRFVDFTKVGLPLNLMLWIAATLFIPYWWPF